MSDQDLFRSIGTQGRLVDRVVEEIEHLILSGKLQPGMKLPPQRELAQQTGVSRTVIREAVQILETKGIVESKHGVGMVVKTFSPDQFSASISWLLRSHNIQLDDLHQVRSILEVENARLAALRANDAGINSLRRILVEMQAVQDDPQRFAEKDTEFHGALAEMTRNSLLVVLIDAIRAPLQEVRLSVSRYPDLQARVMPDHYRILECIADNDSEGACREMRTHLEHAREIQEHFLNQQNDPDQGRGDADLR